PIAQYGNRRSRRGSDAAFRFGQPVVTPRCRSGPRLFLAVLGPPAGSLPEWRSGLAPPDLAGLLARLGRLDRLDQLGPPRPARRRVFAAAGPFRAAGFHRSS